MPRSMYSAEEKLNIIQKFKRSPYGLRKFISVHSINLEKSTLLRWLHLFERDGIDGLSECKHWNRYSLETKQKVVREYLTGTISLEALVVKYGVRSNTTVRQWVSKYNGTNKQASKSQRKQVPIMAKQTTFEERIEIVEYAITHNRNYKETAAKFNVSYQQVRAWVLKVDRDGFPALKDRRGHRKAESEMSEVERLKLENRRLKAELNDKKAIEAFAKKLLALKRHKP